MPSIVAKSAAAACLRGTRLFTNRKVFPDYRGEASLGSYEMAESCVVEGKQPVVVAGPSVHNKLRFCLALEQMPPDQR